MCLDHPDKVERAAIMDIIPQHHLLNHVTRQWGTFSWHWFFNIQPEPLPDDVRQRIRAIVEETDRAVGVSSPV